MDKRCTVCSHSQAHDINLALLAGTTLDILKQQFGLSRSALHRHKLHLQRTIDKAEDRMRHNFLLSYLFQLNDCNAAAAATMAAARAEGNARLTLQAANAGARIINTMARFEVDLDHETVYRLMTSPEYVQPNCLLPGDPQILIGPRQTLVRSLAAACPETASAALFDPEDVGEYLKLAQEPDANTYLPQTRQLEFPGFLVPLADVLPAAASDPPSNARDKQPELKRDRSGTEAGQTSPFSEFIEEYQSDIKEEQIRGTEPASASVPNSMLSDQQAETKRDLCGTEAGQTSPLSKINEEIQKDVSEEQISGTKLDAEPAFDHLPAAFYPLPTASCKTDPVVGLDAPPANPCLSNPSSLIPNPCLSDTSSLFPDPWSLTPDRPMFPNPEADAATGNPGRGPGRGTGRLSSGIRPLRQTGPGPEIRLLRLLPPANPPPPGRPPASPGGKPRLPAGKPPGAARPLGGLELRQPRPLQAAPGHLYIKNLVFLF